MPGKTLEEQAREMGIPAVMSLQMLRELGEEPHKVKCPECAQEQFSGPYEMVVCGNCGGEYESPLRG